MKIISFFRLLASTTLLALMITGCTTAPQQPSNPTQISSQWLLNTATFQQKTITGIIVVGVLDNPTDRRVFEDAICNTFAFGGIPATPSYDFFSQSQEILTPTNSLNVAKLRKAAIQTKASHILFVRSLGQKTNLLYSPGVTWGPGPFGPGPFGGPWGPDPFWGPDWAIPPSITQQVIAQSNAELLLASDGLLLWSASLSTVLGEDPQVKTYQLYGSLLLTSLTQNGFLIPLPDNSFPTSPKFDPSLTTNLK